VPQPPYEEIDHPADIALRVRGGSLAELLANAGRGMAQLMVNPATVNARESRGIEARGEDEESLLVAWLQEILFAFDADRFAPREVTLDSLDGLRARGTIAGEPLNTARHEVRNLIKAVTWHDLEIKKTAGTYEVVIVFDV